MTYHFIVQLLILLFEVVYRFHPLTPLHLLSILSNIFVSESVTSKSNLIKTLYKEAGEN